jgi:hypothetical protein
MRPLSLETFVAGARDMETKQYEVLHGLKQFYSEYHRNRLYPGLAELIDLWAALDDFIQKKKDIQNRLPHRLKELDFENRKLVFESIDTNADLERVSDLIVWALPLIKLAIDEGMSIYNFVDAHMAIEGVGILPMYREEGYWFVPDNRASLLHLLRYEASLFTSATGRFRALKTQLLDSVKQACIRHSPESIKLGLIEKYRDLPNPATYVCETDLEFPYNETILPVAKRKLMSAVFA